MMDATVITSSKKTPLGVYLLAVFEIVISAIFIIIGIIALFRSSATYRGLGFYRGYVSGPANHPVLGLILIFLGLIHALLVFGLWNGKRWAYIWVVVVSILYIALGVVMLDILGYANYINLALNIVILVYFLVNSKVKAYFA